MLQAINVFATHRPAPLVADHVARNLHSSEPRLAEVGEDGVLARSSRRAVVADVVAVARFPQQFCLIC